jgi:predicted XRE-type DNA-binding protein
MPFEILRQCERELEDWPEEVRGDLADAIVRLERGQMLSMPLSRPMPSVGAGVHELRFRDRSGIYRTIYSRRWSDLVSPCLSEEDSKDATAKYRCRKRSFKESSKVKHSSPSEISKRLKISKSRGLEAVLKADFISAILAAASAQKVTHTELAKRSGLPRSAVTGILSGSLQKVTLDRILRLIEAVGLTVEAKVKRAA